jgi:hypothetical protein
MLGMILFRNPVEIVFNANLPRVSMYIFAPTNRQALDYTLLSWPISKRVSQSPKRRMTKLPIVETPKLIVPNGRKTQPRHRPTRYPRANPNTLRKQKRISRQKPPSRIKWYNAPYSRAINKLKRMAGSVMSDHGWRCRSKKPAIVS